MRALRAVVGSVAAIGLPLALPGADTTPNSVSAQLPPGLHGPLTRFGALLPTWHGRTAPPGVLGAPITRSGLPRRPASGS